VTILVTGSAGHLGEALMRTLRAGGTPALGADLLPSAFTDCVGTICERDFVRRILSGVTVVIHSATLHKPHLATHSAQDFVDTNISGTLNLLEEATSAGVQAFVYTSTTSVFGAALRPDAGKPAVWVTEELRPVLKNMYGVTKSAAEELCELFHRRTGLPALVLRTGRFFPEVDDDAAIREHYDLPNVQANEMLYRRVDLEDLVNVHLLAAKKASAIGFRRYVISTTTPFSSDDTALLRRDAARVVERVFPDYKSIYSSRNWKLFPTIDRVYVNALARRELGWNPKYDFRHVLNCARAGRDFRSPLACEVGSKGYHATAFTSGPYPLA